ncbi:hypothetical protein TSAR_013868 [Trichomalopsis sarcophagae]|uniref:Sulfatase N-terminal domain-containing protein n=1 Tax=Trichomalopsis sarcophagae TaxID=543379 RepID=A0A232EF45_9HYME|nr:hypothetical protein TSAR_013868 [Trichomalopsis sarcophagae]
MFNIDLTGMQGTPMRPAEPRGIPLNVTLMPEHMRRLGYETRLVGKWHVGYTTKDYTPVRRGFDTFFGYYNGFISYYDYWLGWNDTNEVTGYDLHRDESDSFELAHSSEYFTDLITDEAEKIIRNNKNAKPLFLEISHLAVHAGSKVNDDPLEVRHTDDVNASFPHIEDYQRRKYAGMMTALDESVGRVVKALKEAEMLDNSIIIFMSDNGAPTVGLYNNTGSNYPMRGIKSGMFEGAARAAACIFSPLIKAHSRVSEELMHIVDWLPTLYTAAGGNPMDLQSQFDGALPLDGVSQWRSIVTGGPSSRQSLLVNIDEAQGFEAAIIGRHKLVKGMTKEDGYYGNSGNDPSFPAYNVKKVLSSTAGASIGNLAGFVSPSARRVLWLRQKSVITCKPFTLAANCSGTCLFDLSKDPCETTDLSSKLPLIVKKLESFLGEYRRVLMPQTNSPQDSCGLPKYFNGVFMPWRTIEFDNVFGSTNSTTCHRPLYNSI